MWNPFRRKPIPKLELRRFLLYKTFCPYCKPYLGLVSYFNAMVKPEKRIMLINMDDIDRYHLVKKYPFLERVKWEAVPYLFFDGICFTGSLGKVYAENFIRGLIENDLLVDV